MHVVPALWSATAAEAGLHALPRQQRWAPLAWLSMRSSAESQPATNRMWESICTHPMPQAGQSRVSQGKELTQPLAATMLANKARHAHAGRPRHHQCMPRSQLPSLACR